MKTMDFLDGFKRRKQWIRDFAYETMLTRMVLQNISDMVPESCTVKETAYVGSIKIEPKEGCTFDVAAFDKLTAKFARAFHRQPSIDVDRQCVTSVFYVYPSFMRKSHKGVAIYITTDNSEKCDFVEVEQTVKSFVPSGYCKLLQEKRYETMKQ